MSVRTYSPTGIPLHSSEVGVVLFNQMGSMVRGDTGRDAQFVANRLGLHVIAADRPGTGFTRRGQGKRLAGNYIDALSRLAAKRIMPEIEATGLNRVVIAGRSAGGLAAMMTTCTEQLPACAVHAQEPVGWQQTTIADGKQAFEAYRKQQATMIADEMYHLIRPDPTDQLGIRGLLRTASILLTAPTDIANNGAVWAQDLALSAAFTIASRLPRVRADIVFAEHSMVADPLQLAHWQIQLPLARSMANRGLSETLEVSVLPQTVHASFDQRDLHARLIGATADHALAYE
jgi:pimeloyl-ACP methyl ester carboxylesterase